MPARSISFPPSSLGRPSGSMGRPGLPTGTISAIRSLRMTMSTGPAGGAPVPSITVTPRRIRRGKGPSPSAARAVFADSSNAIPAIISAHLKILFIVQASFSLDGIRQVLLHPPHLGLRVPPGRGEDRQGCESDVQQTDTAAGADPQHL